MMNKMIAKNNQGAALLENGYYKDALTVLNIGLAQLRSYIQNDGQESDDDMEVAIISDEQGQPDTMEEDYPAARLDASRTLEGACSETTARRREGIYSVEDETCSADLNEDFVFRHPMFITPEMNCEDETTIFIASESDCCGRTNEVVLSVILVFNIALAHHLLAMDLEHNNAKRPLLLKRAVQLYKLGYSMQVEENDVRLSLTYTMATINNWAQITKELNDEQQSKRLFKHLLVSLMVIIESGATDEIDEIDGFMGNASKIILRDCSFAAAA